MWWCGRVIIALSQRYRERESLTIKMVLIRFQLPTFPNHIILPLCLQLHHVPNAPVAASRRYTHCSSISIRVGHVWRLPEQKTRMWQQIISASSITKFLIKLTGKNSLKNSPKILTLLKLVYIYLNFLFYLFLFFIVWRRQWNWIARQIQFVFIHFYLFIQWCIQSLHSNSQIKVENNWDYFKWTQMPAWTLNINTKWTWSLTVDRTCFYGGWAVLETLE